MTSNQETLAGVAQCTSTGHGDAEAPQTLPMRTLFAASVGNAVEWYEWTVDVTFSIYFATQIFPAENESLAFIGTFATYASTRPVTPTDCEQKDEPERPQHGRAEGERAAPHGGDPGEDLDAGRHCDDHGREREIGLSIHADARHIHVMRPGHEADHADGDHRIDHAEIAEHWLL